MELISFMLPAMSDISLVPSWHASQLRVPAGPGVSLRCTPRWQTSKTDYHFPRNDASQCCLSRLVWLMGAACPTACILVGHRLAWTEHMCMHARPHGSIHIIAHIEGHVTAAIHRSGSCLQVAFTCACRGCCRPTAGHVFTEEMRQAVHCVW